MQNIIANAAQSCQCNTALEPMNFCGNPVAHLNEQLLVSSELIAQVVHTIIDTILATPTTMQGISGINQAKKMFGHFMLQERSHQFRFKDTAFIYSQHSEWEYQTWDNVDLTLHEYDPVDWSTIRHVIPIYAAASPYEYDDPHDDSKDWDDSAAGSQAVGSATACRKSVAHFPLSFSSRHEKVLTIRLNTGD